MISSSEKTLCEHLGGVGGDGVEDVDQDEEEGDQEGHPTGDHVHRDQERDPRHDHKQACVPQAENSNHAIITLKNYKLMAG